MVFPIFLIILGLFLTFIDPLRTPGAVIFGLICMVVGGFLIYRKFSRRRIF